MVVLKIGCGPFAPGPAPPFLLGMALVLSWFQPPVSAQSPVPEYRVKATFLFQFTQFVDWPPEAFGAAEAPLVIAVLGEDPFGRFLDDTVRDEKANGHPLVVQRYQRIEEVKNCHVLYLAQQEARRIPDIESAFKQRNILTVSDAVDFTSRGGIIQFVTQEKRVGLRINLSAAKSANLTISSKLLRLARVI
jgi:hypothetical protein